MKQVIVCICILLVIASCKLSNTTDSPGNQHGTGSQVISKDSVTIFLTGNVIGSLKPCGCSGGQKGGLDRRPAIFNTVPADKRLLIDTGSFVEDQKNRNPIEKDQDFIKFLTITEALDYMKYDIVNLSKQDLKIAQDNGLIGAFSLNYITAYESYEDIAPGYKNHLSLDGEEIEIFTVSYDPVQAPLEYITQIFPRDSESKNVNILILNSESTTDFDEIITEISKLGVVDCIIYPLNSDEPTSRGTKPLICSPGAKGRYISSIVIHKTTDNKLLLTFNDAALEEEIERDPNLVQLYKTYQTRVADAGLLGKNGRFPLENDLEYMGSESCESSDCHSEPSKHSYEYAEWKMSDHSKAYATLVEVGSQYDPECIECHVVGYEDESGFTTLEETPKLINVGCEICHGPGSEHNKDPYNNKTKPIEDIEKQCLQCHTPEHSGDFAGNEEEKIKLINHWPEPNDVSDVK